MDKTKLKIDITEIWRTLDRLETETDPNNRRVQDDIYRIRQRVYMIQNELGIVRDLADLKSEAQPLEKIYTCPTCGAHHEDGGRGKPPVYCDECGADWPA